MMRRDTLLIVLLVVAILFAGSALVAVVSIRYVDGQFDQITAPIKELEQIQATACDMARRAIVDRPDVISVADGVKAFPGDSAGMWVVTGVCKMKVGPVVPFAVEFRRAEFGSRIEWHRKRIVLNGTQVWPVAPKTAPIHAPAGNY